MRSVNVFYYNTIGVLRVNIGNDLQGLVPNKTDNLNTNTNANANVNMNVNIVKKIDTNSFKLVHKNEDGNLTIKISFREFNNNKINDPNYMTDTNDIYNYVNYNLTIFFSSSMTVLFKDTQVAIDKNGSINLKYFVKKNLISKDKIIEKVQSYHITDCFNNLNDGTDDDKDYMLTSKNWRNFKSIDCKACSNEVLSLNHDNSESTMLIFNFNYDFVNNLELLSCHESDINNIIPNIDDKLKNMYIFILIKRLSIFFYHYEFLQF